MKLELNPDEVKLLLDFMQNATINNINGHAMWALSAIMSRLGKEVVAIGETEQNPPSDGVSK